MNWGGDAGITQQRKTNKLTDGVLATYPKGTEIRFTSMEELPHFELHLEVPGTDEELCFSCEARRLLETGDEIQVDAIFSDPKGTYLQELGGYLI